MNSRSTILSAEPFFLPGGPNGCLLVHGFTGTPKEMRGLGEYLNLLGYTVIGIHLSGHATEPEDMNRVRFTDWMVDLEDGWNLLHSTLDSKYKKSCIFAIGLSMGGILSLIFSSKRYQAHYPINGVVGLSTPYAIRGDWRLSFVKVLQYIKPGIEKQSTNWRDPQVAIDHIDYPVYPTRSLLEFRDLTGVFHASLAEVTTPTLLIHARSDTGGGHFEENSMQKIYDALGSDDKEMIWIEDSDHNILVDKSRTQAYQNIAHFISRIHENTGCTET